MMLGYRKGRAGPVSCTVLAAGFAFSAVSFGAMRGAAADGTPAEFERYCARTFPNSTFEQRTTRSGREFFCRQPGATGGHSLQKVTAGEICQSLTGRDAVHRHGDTVHCSRDIRDGRYLLGLWTITPYNIVNWQECGPVRYSAQLEVRQRLSAAHYTGVTKFTWDTSRLVPGCSFTAAERGTIPTELFVDGDQITVKYRATGNNNYADDHLVLRANVMAGTDVAGQRVVYTKTSDTASQTSLSSATPSGQN